MRVAHHGLDVPTRRRTLLPVSDLGEADTTRTTRHAPVPAGVLHAFSQLRRGSCDRQLQPPGQHSFSRGYVCSGSLAFAPSTSRRSTRRASCPHNLHSDRGVLEDSQHRWSGHTRRNTVERAAWPRGVARCALTRLWRHRGRVKSTATCACEWEGWLARQLLRSPARPSAAGLLDDDRGRHEVTGTCGTFPLTSLGAGGCRVKNPCSSSSGSGNTIVLFFSAAISVKVCRYLS
jgi:hypothetical protein